MEQYEFNAIGIDPSLDWKRIRKLLLIGLFAAGLATLGDMLLGWGVQDETVTGIARMFSAYTAASEKRLLAVALLGLFGMSLEGLCLFGIYRLMAEKSPRYAHSYRSGIIGYLIFGPCGFHVPVCAAIFTYKKMQELGLEAASEVIKQYVGYFILPAFILFWIFFIVLEGTHILAFLKEKTPYPKWCWIFCMPVGMIIAKLFLVFGNHAWVNAIDCAWIHIGCLWMYGGLLVMMRKQIKDI